MKELLSKNNRENIKTTNQTWVVKNTKGQIVMKTEETELMEVKAVYYGKLKDIVEDVKRTLKCYDETYITYEYGEYKEMPMIGIYKEYAPDHKFIGSVRAKDIYTLEERIENYESEFKCTAYGLRAELKRQKEEL